MYLNDFKNLNVEDQNNYISYITNGKYGVSSFYGCSTFVKNIKSCNGKIVKVKATEREVLNILGTKKFKEAMQRGTVLDRPKDIQLPKVSTEKDEIIKELKEKIKNTDKEIKTVNARIKETEKRLEKEKEKEKNKKKAKEKKKITKPKTVKEKSTKKVKTDSKKKKSVDIDTKKYNKLVEKDNKKVKKIKAIKKMEMLEKPIEIKNSIKTPDTNFKKSPVASFIPKGSKIGGNVVY